MGEALLIDALIKSGKEGHHVSSAGIGALVGHKPDPIAIELMKERGIDITEYRGTQLNSVMTRKADLILVMESGHKTHIENKENSAKGKVFTLGQWSKFEIPDPYRKNRDAFEHALDLIDQGINDWIKRI